MTCEQNKMVVVVFVEEKEGGGEEGGGGEEEEHGGENRIKQKITEHTPWYCVPNKGIPEVDRYYCR